MALVLVLHRLVLRLTCALKERCSVACKNKASDDTFVASALTQLATSGPLMKPAGRQAGRQARLSMQVRVRGC